MRRGIRVVGVDDGPAPKRRGAAVFVAAPVVRATGELDGLLTTGVRRDGWNATAQLKALLGASRFLPQIHAVMLDGIALGGLNVVDIRDLSASLWLPVITVMRHRPDVRGFRAAVERLPRPARRWALVERAGPVHRAGPIYFQCVGADADWARALLAQTTLNGNLPEPIRLAHLIAGGVVDGESRGRA
jgi:endonuclease V-like protein UPF0215 family